MTTWNYRIFKLYIDQPENICYELREVFYDEHGNIKGHTPVTMISDDPMFTFMTNKLLEANEKPYIEVTSVEYRKW